MKLGLQKVREDNIYEISSIRSNGQIISEEVERFVEINSEPDFDVIEFVADDNFSRICKDWKLHKQTPEYKAFLSTIRLAILYGSIKAYFERTGGASAELIQQYNYLLNSSKKLLKKMKITLESSDELQ
ncbi:MAG: hypothetical protein IPM97_00280 [Bdellovibrionaceae bacterium]|nr:hypothetical protein [Pseudobdellovibrionaceae bacterium]